MRWHGARAADCVRALLETADEASRGAAPSSSGVSGVQGAGSAGELDTGIQPATGAPRFKTTASAVGAHVGWAPCHTGERTADASCPYLPLASTDITRGGQGCSLANYYGLYP